MIAGTTGLLAASKMQQTARIGVPAMSIGKGPVFRGICRQRLRPELGDPYPEPLGATSFKSAGSVPVSPGRQQVSVQITVVYAIG